MIIRLSIPSCSVPRKNRGIVGLFVAIALVLCALSVFPAQAEEPAVSQFLVDPSNPDQGFVLTDTSLQFNSALKNGGRWSVKFDREKFRSLTGQTAQPGYRHRKVQTSRTRRGALFLLVDKGTAAQRYIFVSADNGESWRLMRGPGRRNADQAPPPSRASAPKTVRVESQPQNSPVPSPAPSSGAEDIVDLGALDSSPAPAAGAGNPSQQSASVPGSPSSSQPLFKFMFDFLFVSRPGISPLTFDTYHSLSLVDIIPRPEIQFSFELAPAPRFYELLYKMSDKLEFRIGKIWVPFDQMNPHNNFGGFWNTSLTRPPGSVAFLPDIWTDLGIAVKYVLTESSSMSAEAEVYVINGLAAGGNDPVSEVGQRYPNFSATGGQDNNTDKAFGGRFKLMFDGSYEFGASAYTGRYTVDDDDSARLTMIGFDARLRLSSKFELRGGYAYMIAGLPTPATESDFKRAGFYAEGTYKFGKHWRLTLLGGQTQNDDRVIGAGDQKVVGGRIGYSLGFMQLYLIYNTDLMEAVGKTKTSYTALRAMLLL